MQQKPKLVFYLIAILLPFLLLGALEGILRLANYGASYPLFVESDQFEGYLEPNPDVIKRFFYPASSAPAVSPDTYLFKEQKTDNTLRIVAMGGSTMAGFPYGRFGSPAGMLKQRISASHPQQKVEIISVAMSSINSFSILDFTEEVIAIEPDAVLIYVGHNEYLGALGVGSSFAGKGSYSANLLFLTLKDWRIYQLVQKIYHLIVTPNPEGIYVEGASTNQRTLMAQVAKDKNIAYKSDIYVAGKTQFEQNLSLILEKLSQAAVPAFVSSIASNEASQAPFESLEIPELDNALLNKNTQKSWPTNAHTALAKDRFHANYMFALGNYLLENGKRTEAYKAFKQARDFDLLRFRAPSEFNEIIQAVSHKHDAIFVDSYATLINDTKNRIIDKSLMLEHLHPNARGYFLIAESFYSSLLEEGLISSENTNEQDLAVFQEDAWRWQPLSLTDQIFAQFKVEQLLSDYPFSDTPTTVRLDDIRIADIEHAIVNSRAIRRSDITLAKQRMRGESYIKIQQQLVEKLQSEGRFLEAGISAGTLFEALPEQENLARVASLLLLRANALPLAEYYASKAVQLNPRAVNYKLSLAEILFKQQKIKASIVLLDEVIAQDPSNLKAKQIRRSLLQ
ncbi:hypothetical protein PN836_004635 [Ningiella sp. W23]|uniref:hypothetical protein n=1 Tax=Ningiella sp. W23 TaxID=3023715 RepID=UPI00375754F4